MSITVSDCLKLSCLKNAKVVSGESGLAKIVTTVSVLEDADMNLLTNNQIFRANEIIISAFASIKDDVVAQCKTLEILHESGDVALILCYVGYIVESLDQRFLDKSDELSFPIIVIPLSSREIGYGDVIGEITEAIYNNRYHETRFVSNMLERIYQLTEHQRTLPNILQMLSNKLKCSLIIMDASDRCICLVKYHTSTWLSEEMLFNVFSNNTDFDKIDLTEIIGETESVIYKVPFSQSQYSHLSLIVVDEGENLAKEELALAVELIEVSSNIWKYDLDTMHLDRLIPAILNDNLVMARHIAETFNINSDAINAIIIAQIDDLGLDLYERHRINDHLVEISEKILKDYNKNPIVCTLGKQVIAAFSFSVDSEEDNIFISEYQKAILEYNPDIVLTFSSNLSTTQKIQNAYLTYCNYFDKTRKIYPKQKLLTLSQLEFCAECTILIKNNLLDENDWLMPLLKVKDGVILIETLATFFLDANCEVKETSQIMFLHRNTIQFRLNKIRKIIGKDFSMLHEKYNAYKTMAVYRLNKEK